MILSIGLHAALISGLSVYSRRHKSTAQSKLIPVAILPEEKQDSIFGQAQGDGNSVDESSLINPQTSDRKSLEQAFLTREPPGLAGKAQTPPQMPQELVTPAEQSVRPVQQQENPLAAAMKKPVQSRKQQEAPEQTPPQERQTASQTTPDKPAGLPAEQKDRDLDLSSEEIALEVSAGKVVARKGRQVKLARPKSNLATFVDSATITFPALIKMKVDVDESGSVRRVTILRSSGSSSIDRAMELAIYESWFEPAKDQSGKTVRDTVDLALLLN